ncbi:MAG: hypothetical protein GX796_13800 [Clostridiaceae bacterium]|jgi:hypothetical protein|nr:hypothetical protein [Clostridiaceae bacterium]
MLFRIHFNPYIAIIGDIKDSKKIISRDEVQEKLKEALNDINKKYHEHIASKFTITLGDEFQGLLYNGENIMAIITEIEMKMSPLRIRFGIGIGEITTEINHEMAIGADGPGYHKAREAVEYIKQNEKRKQASEVDVRLEIEGERQETVDLINTILSLMTTIKHSWSERQRQTIWDMLEFQDSQSNAAQRLGIRQSSVQKNLANGNYYTYKEAMNTVEKAFSEIRRNDV